MSNRRGSVAAMLQLQRYIRGISTKAAGTDRRAEALAGHGGTNNLSPIEVARLFAQVAGPITVVIAPRRRGLSCADRMAATLCRSDGRGLRDTRATPVRRSALNLEGSTAPMRATPPADRFKSGESMRRPRMPTIRQRSHNDAPPNLDTSAPYVILTPTDRSLG
jgi:hypothetical protein